MQPAPEEQQPDPLDTHKLSDMAPTMRLKLCLAIYRALLKLEVAAQQDRWRQQQLAARERRQQQGEPQELPFSAEAALLERLEAEGDPLNEKVSRDDIKLVRRKQRRGMQSNSTWVQCQWNAGRVAEGLARAWTEAVQTCEPHFPGNNCSSPQAHKPPTTNGPLPPPRAPHLKHSPLW
jgi:hypothetical protein